MSGARGDEGGRVLDAVGEETLELFREHDRYSELLFEALSGLAPGAPSGRVLEVGCGIGNVTRLILRSPGVELLHAIDVDPAYVRRVAAEVRDPRLRLTAARAEDLAPGQGGMPRGHGDRDERFDAIVSTNVLEHIEDHAQVLRNFRALLSPEGLVLLLVPAHRFLYSGLDRSLSHFRRYSRRDLEDLAAACGLRVLRARLFNPLGAIGWWLNGTLLRRRVLPPRQVALYARFAIPLSRLLDRLNPFPFGVSLLAVLARAAEGTERNPRGAEGADCNEAEDPGNYLPRRFRP